MHNQKYMFLKLYIPARRTFLSTEIKIALKTWAVELE